MDNNTRVHQEFYYGDAERHPLLRGKLTRTITHNSDGDPFIEESILNIDDKIESKRFISSTQENETFDLMGINKAYKSGRLYQMEYPILVEGRSLLIAYSYDKLGNVVGVGVPGERYLFAKFSYNAGGQISTEEHIPYLKDNFTRKFIYNSAGFLSILEDKFLTERVYYTDSGYGANGYGDGTITRTEFEANWHQYCDNRKIGLNKHSFIHLVISPDQSEICFGELKKLGYLNDFGLQNKIFYPNLESNLPIVCNYGINGRFIQKVLGSKGYPKFYGHSYDYGNHQDLTKAKYFIGQKVPKPLQPDTFYKEIPGINITMSYDIWESLKKYNYVIQNSEKSDKYSAHGKRGKSLISPNLAIDLKHHMSLEIPVERLLVKHFLNGQYITSFKDDLQNMLRSSGTNEVPNEIFEILNKNGYFQNPFAEEFHRILEKYKLFATEITRTLSNHFATELGEAEFDIESYDIDPNGNHKKFYTGSERYKINYQTNSNKISNVEYKSFHSSEQQRSFDMKHDNRGNVIQALHKDIFQIDYHPVSNRALRIKLNNGTTLEFQYDARGERILKKVCDKTGQTKIEIHYIRDDFGKVLVEKEVTYVNGNLQPEVSVTAYIYGPRGLLGFMRNNVFYSVITDHEGSVRLVVKGNEIISVYDYLPYGNLMRKYENDPEGRISYRYTGQEWDEELGLYNYHARFYDPSIGRFYQVDPKNQYFSPYKYAGNSPISKIDPDGELAFFILIPLIMAGATTGIYLGGSAANNRWNPAEWDLRSKESWLGIVGGGVGGAFFPVGFIGSVGAFTAVGFSTTTAVGITTGFGIGGGYLGMAAANSNWNPEEWNFKSPETWNAGFHGFGLGSSVPVGVSGSIQFYNSLASSLSKRAFVTSSALTGASLFTLNGYSANWDFSNPRMFYGAVDALAGAPDLPMLARSGYKFLKRGYTKVKAGLYNNKYDKLPSYGEVYIETPESILSYTVMEPGLIHIADSIKHNEIKYFTKFVGIFGLPIALSYLNNNLDLNNPDTYRDAFGAAITIKQIFLTSKYGFRHYKIGKILKHNDAVKQFTLKVAESAVKQYKHELYDFTQIKKVVEKECLVIPAIKIKKTATQILQDVILTNKDQLKNVASTLNDNEISKVTKHIVDDVAKIYTEKTENPRELGFIENLKDISKKIILDIIEFYKNKITSTDFTDVENVKILNRAVAVLTTPTHSIVGFSSNQFTGFIALYANKNFKGNELLHAIFLSDNSKIAGDNVIIAQHPKLNEWMIEHMKKNQENIKTNNIEKLHDAINRESIYTMLGDKINSNVREEFVEVLKNILRENKWTSAKSLSNTITEIHLKHNDNIQRLMEAKVNKVRDLSIKQAEIKAILEDQAVKAKWFQYKHLSKDLNVQKEKLKKSPNKTDIKNAYEVLLKKFENLETDDKISKLQLLNLTELDLQKEINNLSKDISRYKASETEKIKEILKDNILIKTVARLDENLVHWDHNNCAEPHAITAFLKSQTLFPNYKVSGPVKYLATYKEGDSRTLVPFKRCSHCIETTKVIDETVITEIDFNTKLKNLYSEAERKIAIYGKLPNFSVYLSNNNSNSHDSMRGKRSIESNLQKISNTLPKYNVKNNANRPYSFINTLFGWVGQGSVMVKNLANSLLPSSYVDYCSESGDKITNISSSPFDFNGTIFLIDTLIRKTTGTKHVPSRSTSISEYESYSHAIYITDQFEKIMKKVARKHGVSIELININFSEIQGNITRQIMSGKNVDILETFASCTPWIDHHAEENMNFQLDLKAGICKMLAEIGNESIKFKIEMNEFKMEQIDPSNLKFLSARNNLPILDNRNGAKFLNRNSNCIGTS